MSDDEKALNESALRLLSRREHSRVELLEKLAQRGFSLDKINPVLDALIEQNLLSDQRFAENYTRARSGKGYGPVRIEQELSQKGVSGELIDETLKDFAGQWCDIAEQVYRKKFGNRPIESYNEQAKRKSFLQYRGFGHDEIKQVVGEVEFIEVEDL